MSLLLAEQNNDLPMRYSKLRPHRLTPLLDANKAAEDKKESKESNHVQSDRPHGRDRGGWKRRGCGHYNSSGRGNHYNRGCRPNFGHGRGRGGCGIYKPQHSTKSVCHRCGMGNHWAKICRTPKHRCDLY
ncbi:unnamed protein product [Arabidopsis halleri]